MAANSQKVDKYSNIINLTVTMSAANTLTYQEIDVGLNIFDKVGMLLNRLEYDPYNATISDLDTDGDNCFFGLVQSNQLSTFDPTDRAVIDYNKIFTHHVGTPASVWAFTFPVVRDYSTLPGGGMLVAPRPLYLAMNSQGMTVAGACRVRVYFTIIKLKPDEYFELLESRRYYG